MNQTIKDFRKKVLSIKEKITEKEFFTSPSCHNYMQALIEAVCKKYNSQIKLNMEWSDTDTVAYATERSSLFLNVNNEYFHRAEGKISKLVILKGLLLHECGHLLFTDFHLANSTDKVFFQNRKLFPEPKCSEYTDFLTDFAAMDDDELKKWHVIYHRLDNSLEDGFVDNMILETLPGEGRCLEMLRNLFYETLDSIKVQKSKGLPIPAILFNSILSLAKYGTVKMDPDDKDEDALKELLKQYDLIKQTIHTQKAYDRTKLKNEIFCKFYHFMKEEQKKEEQKEEQKNKDTSSEENKDNSNSQQNKNSSEIDSNKDNSSQNSLKKCSASSEEHNNDGSGNEQNNINSRPSAQDILDNMQGSVMKDNINTGSGSVLNDNNIRQKETPTSKNNNEKLDAMQNISLQTTPSPIDIHQADNIATDIAESKVNEELEKDLAMQLEKDCKNTDFSPINNKVQIKLTREAPSQYAYTIYEKDMVSIRFLVKKTIDELKRKLKDRQQGGKLNGLYMGRYLDQHSLGRFDLRMLCKNDLPEDIPNMAFCIYLDNSYSMNGNKIIKARQTCLLLYHIGLSLNIPVMVYTHHASGDTVYLNALADFGSVDGLDKYRICDMQACGCNRDGMGLRFCSERLSQRTEEVKLMFVISDGLPSFYNSKKEAEMDIKNVLTDYSKKQLKYITVGLGEDQTRIEHLYTQDLSPAVAARFLSTENEDELPTMLVETIKKIISK